MKLYINNQMVLPVLGSLRLRKTRAEAAATLTAVLYTAPADTYFQSLELALGQQVCLVDEEGAQLFLGSIHELQRNQESVRITAYDLGICLTRNELRGVFCGSPASIIAQVAAALTLPLGTVEAPSGQTSIIAPRGQSAFSILRQAMGDKREISLRNGRLCVTKSAYMVYPLEPSQVLEAASSVSLAEMVNRCEIVDRTGKVLTAAQNAADITRYGLMQQVVADDGTSPAARLQSVAAGGRVTVVGNPAYLCGCAVELHRGEWGLDGVYAVTAAEHCWEKGQYTAVLDLEFIR